MNIKTTIATLTLLLVASIGCGDKETVDTGNEITGPQDLDGDGYLDDVDCDDTNAEVNPAAIEVCDEIDNNCDGTADENTTTRYYGDADGDGYGDNYRPTDACTQPDWAVTNGDDCDDDHDDTYPEAQEYCDERDNDCDGDIDEGVTYPWYPDEDGDGFGAGDEAVYACSPPEHTAGNNEDCDDDNDVINPDAPEIMDGIDNNCDSEIDETEETDGK